MSCLSTQKSICPSDLPSLFVHLPTYRLRVFLLSTYIFYFKNQAVVAWVQSGHFIRSITLHRWIESSLGIDGYVDSQNKKRGCCLKSDSCVESLGINKKGYKQSKYTTFEQVLFISVKSEYVHLFFNVCFESHVVLFNSKQTKKN